MEPVSVILQALAAGAWAAASDVATDAIKSAYGGFKELIQRRLTGKPDAESVLAEYEKDPETWEKPLGKKLKELGIDQDTAIVQEAERLLDKINSLTKDSTLQTAQGTDNQQILDQRKVINTGGDFIEAAEGVIKSGQNVVSEGARLVQALGDVEQNTTEIHNSQSRSTLLLLGVVVLALAGVSIFAVHRVQAGKPIFEFPWKPPSSEAQPKPEVPLSQFPEQAEPTLAPSPQDSASSLTGRWRHTQIHCASGEPVDDISSTPTFLDISEDGTVLISFKSEAWKFKILNERVMVEELPNGQEYAYDYRVSGDTLIISGWIGGEEECLFKFSKD